LKQRIYDYNAALGFLFLIVKVSDHFFHY
jgi:hypothetical protein